MEYSFFDFLTLLGSLGIFLYGMKLMSEGLQKIAGNKLRSILTAMTSNPLAGVATGVLVTAIIQSSSATTVMVVSFVNAGLLSLAQSISVIMGANIGTTATAWLVTLGGMGKFSLSSISIPLVAVALPFLFSGRSKFRAWGEFIIGFAFLFFGLGLLGASVPDLKSNPEILEFLTRFTGMGYGSVVLFLFIGTLLTVVVQSSSATMAITLIMLGNGWIGFEIAAAMVMGENIGTTITANLAALSGNISAKRAAFAHFMFNILGVCWLLMLFYPFVNLVQFLSETLGFDTLAGKLASDKITQPEMLATLQLSLFHSVFNVINTSIMIWFVKGYVYIVTNVIKSKNEDNEEFQLKFIEGGLLSTAELSLVQANQEIALYGERTQRMFGMVRQLANTKEGSVEYNKLFSRIEKYEQVSDRFEIEIAEYLNQVAEGELSALGKARVRRMLNRVTEIESIADSCFNMARTLLRKQDAGVKFNETIERDIESMFKLVESAVAQLNTMLHKKDNFEAEIAAINAKEIEINNFRNQLRNQNVEHIKDKVYGYQAGIYFMDMINECEKLVDYIINITEEEEV